VAGGAATDPLGGDGVTPTETTAAGSGTGETAAATGASGVPTGPGDVTVLVLNGAGAKGVAGEGVALLDGEGYDTLDPKNATGLGPSQVLYREGSETAASQVASVFGADAAGVVAPLDQAALPIDDTQGADIVVVIGEDGLLAP
jgi:hypothetical protein